jgi:hypothetical protein
MPETARVVLKVDATFRVMPPETPEFNHYTPASWLIEHPEQLIGDHEAVTTALGRFEKLFERLNTLLPGK